MIVWQWLRSKSKFWGSRTGVRVLSCFFQLHSFKLRVFSSSKPNLQTIYHEENDRKQRTHSLDICRMAGSTNLWLPSAPTSRGWHRMPCLWIVALDAAACQHPSTTRVFRSLDAFSIAAIVGETDFIPFSRLREKR